MLIRDKVVVVTGGGNGIGEAMCRRFAADAASAVVVVDREERRARDVARSIHGLAITADVGVEQDVQRIVSTTIAEFGRVDLLCSNAGISVGGALETTTTDDWQRIWQVNVMAHVFAARAALPVML